MNDEGKISDFTEKLSRANWQVQLNSCVTKIDSPFNSVQTLKLKVCIFMELKIIFIYSFCSDFLNSLGIKSDPQSKMNQAEIMTVAITSALFFGGNFSRARHFLMWNGHVRRMLSESRLNRKLHEIEFSLWETVFKTISHAFQKTNSSFEYLVDSMPVEVCANYRSYRLNEIAEIQVIPERKANAKRQHSGCLRYLQSILRKRIETTFSGITRLFPRKIEAVTANGFLMKLLIFISSFALQHFL